MKQQRQNGGRKRKTISTKSNPPSYPADVIGRLAPAGLPSTAVTASEWVTASPGKVTDIGDISKLNTTGTSCAVAVSITLKT
jgi:hypothetical protein